MPVVAPLALGRLDALRARAEPSAPNHGAHRALLLADGRALAWQTHGDPDGRPLYVFHGFPGSRLQAGLVHDEARRRGICLIAPDRPGFGASTRQRGRRIEDWPVDVARLADHLGHARFGVLGVSCGGPYALACARALPGRVAYTGLMAGMGPMDSEAVRRDQAPALRLLFRLARRHRLLAAPFLGPDAWLLRRRPAAALAALSRLMSEPDRRVLAERADIAPLFAAGMAEAYAQGIGAALDEACLIARLDGLALAGIEAPVHLYQGEQDRHVPPALARRIAAALPRARLRVYPDEGHLSILINRFGACADDFASATPH